MSDEDLTSTLKARAKEKLRRDIGPLVLDALADRQTVEILLNPDGRLWQERLGETLRCIGTLSTSRGEAVIKTIAGFHGKEITQRKPYIEAEFPLDGSRFAGQLPPIVQAPTFAIRKRAIAIFTLDQYVDAGIMTAHQAGVIRQAVAAKKNILISGGTGSGKTTLVNAIINEMVEHNPDERVLIFEDTREIQCAAEDAVQYHSTHEVTMTRLLAITKRMRPDRIFLGEMRGPEALDLLMIWNSGHEGGAATLHANNARASLSKLRMLISMHPDCPKPIEPLIAEVVQVVVHIARTAHGRRVEEIIEVCGYEDGQYAFRNL
jgi:P-type conjugative transfer ATPase TrbB